ncbi:anti-sigma factor antagonist [Streptomyces griseus]|uniref:anti-sigma factor antagonist n=1 Tax=Streptomyces griseus TaxID=1911 RepID=UPI0038203C4D
MHRNTGGDESGLLILHTLYPTAYVMVLRGNTSPTTSGDLDAAFRHAADSGLPLIVDLAALDFGDVELLGHLIHAHRTAGLQLVGPLSPLFQQRLDTTGTTTLLTVQPTLSAALDH